MTPARSNDPAKADDAEPTWPDPARYWWLKRLAMASLLLAFGLAGLRAFWGREATRRLGRELEPIIALGEPVSGPAMNPPPLPDAENGALLYLKAMAAFGTDSPSTSAMDFPEYPPFPPRWHKMEDKSVATNGEVFRLVREARRFGRFDWGTRMTAPSYAIAAPTPIKVRHMAALVLDAALHAHVHGDDFEALARVRDLRHLAAAIDAPPGFLRNHLVGEGIDAVTLCRLEIITPELTIAPEGDDPPMPATSPVTSRTGATQPAARPATREQVRALIAELLDESDQLRNLRRSFVVERAASLDTADWFGSRAPLLRPMFQLDAVRMVRADNTLIAAATLPNSPAVNNALSAEPLLKGELRQIAAVFSPVRAAPGARAKFPPVDHTRILSTHVIGANLARSIEVDMRVRMERRLAAAALAARLYRLDHAGQFPPSLEALVPAYLPQVPIDPAAPDGRPLKYLIIKGGLPDGGDRPIVYSVGTDGTDRTAEVGPGKAGLPNQPVYDYCRGVDQWRDLKRWAPPRTPAEEAEEDRQERVAQRMQDALDAATPPPR
jgi:hypothetical protein